MSLKVPDYIPVMRKAECEETRKRLDFAYNTRALKENTELLKRILALRQGLFVKIKAKQGLTFHNRNV